jgi:protein TonB
MRSPIQRRVYIPDFRPPTVGVATRAMSFEDGPVVIGSAPGPIGGDLIGVAVPQVTPPPPKPPAKKEEPVVSRLAVGGNVLAAQILNRVQPVYPPLARQARIDGVVQLHGVISREGRIVSLRVISGHPLLTKAALDAVSQWTYKPTFLNGQPIEVEAPIEVRFVLSR